MMSSEGRILVFAGSTRADSVNRKLAKLVAESLSQESLAATFLDLRDYPMPLYDGEEDGVGPPAAVDALAEAVALHDALVIASPEFNGSFSALLKNALDWISRPIGNGPPCAVYAGKLAALMSATPSRGGGLRGLRQLRDLLENMGAEVMPGVLSVPVAHEAFSESGNLKREADRQALATFTAELKAALAARSMIAGSPQSGVAE